MHSWQSISNQLLPGKPCVHRKGRIPIRVVGYIRLLVVLTAAFASNVCGSCFAQQNRDSEEASNQVASSNSDELRDAGPDNSESGEGQAAAVPNAAAIVDGASNSAAADKNISARVDVVAPASSDTNATHQPGAAIQNDAVTLGLLLVILGFIFWSSTSDIPLFRGFYNIVPMLLMCYFVPSLLTFFGIVNPEESKLYFVASRYLLPASLVLLTLSVDLQEIIKLGPKALIMFLTGTLGVVVGGPLAMLIVGAFSPELVGGQGPEAVWRGLATVAGSWIGGGANQAAMKEIFETSDAMFSVMVTVDVLVAELWMMFLLLGIGQAKKIDRLFRANSASVRRLQRKMEAFSLKSARNPTTAELFAILAIGFGCTGLAHWLADAIAPWVAENAPQLKKLSLDSQFFWLIVLATTFGVGLSFSRFRNLEGAGASKIGTVFIFVLVATIGLGMDLRAVFEHAGLFVVGLVWMAIHVGLLFTVGFLIRAPYFFLAVGSKANIGGAASAPVVAAAFHPSLAPVGVLLAVMGYALGTYAAYLCGLMMQAVAG